jgi:D-arabinose 1-dehydrogenase-like Zn-dependent alcohol dehydrogenase
LSTVDAAPLMRAGITTFNALRNNGARPGETVAVIGLGGLGHLGVQFATKLGFRTVAIARGQDKVPLAHELGAHHYIDNAAEVIGAVESVTIDARALLRGRRSIKGWYSGTSIDSQETLAFSALTGVRPMTEIIPLERAAEGYERMMSGKARFRVVLTTES